MGVLGTKADTGPTAATITAIIRLGLRTASEPIRARKRSRPPLRNKPAEMANRPIRVIKAGLPKPATASSGVSTPLAISRAAASRPVSSGASQPLTNSTTEPASTSKVISAPGCSTAESRSATGAHQGAPPYNGVQIGFTDLTASQPRPLTPSKNPFPSYLPGFKCQTRPYQGALAWDSAPKPPMGSWRSWSWQG